MITLRNWWRRKSPADQHAFVLDTCFWIMAVTLIGTGFVIWSAYQ